MLSRDPMGVKQSAQHAPGTKVHTGPAGPAEGPDRTGRTEALTARGGETP